MKKLDFLVQFKNIIEITYTKEATNKYCDKRLVNIDFNYRKYICFYSCYHLGRYAFQIWKPLEQVITETVKNISSPVS